MKKYMDKISKKIFSNKKILIFFTTLFIIAIILSAVFFTLLNSNDKILVNEYLNEFMNNIKGNINYLDIFKNSFLSNLGMILGIWLLGISVIGLPLIIFIFFIKSFILGFATSSLIFTFKIKGSLMAFIYIFPHHIINMLLLYLISMYAISFSIKMIKAILKKKNIEFKNVTSYYIKILCVCLIGIILTSLVETFLTTSLLNIVANNLTILI